jgi:3',5'-cyclic AMP phosphodiesterase CpdA
MPAAAPLLSFEPNLPDAAGIISWAHIGDLHMTEAGEQNDLDLISIVDEINRAFAVSLSFVYIPGDVADDGSVSEYTAVREAIDRLEVPWCSIIGDHDVHEKSFDNYLAFMAHAKHYSFQIGTARFVALNAFDIPDPGSFCLLDEQLDWLEQELRYADQERQAVVLLLHCYPTDLKRGGGRLRKLVEGPSVRLIDMGHTHYNEFANDGRTLYTATRSTGQIEEGPVGFSVTNIDGQVVSWKFLALDELPAVIITSPADERFITDATLAGHIADDRILVRAKTWANAEIKSAVATLEGHTTSMSQIPRSSVWQVELEGGALVDGVYILTVAIADQNGHTAEDSIRLVLGASGYQSPERSERDQDNAIEAWPERGLLGTQLGPNKNGRKW